MQLVMFAPCRLGPSFHPDPWHRSRSIWSSSCACCCASGLSCQARVFFTGRCGVSGRSSALPREEERDGPALTLGEREAAFMSTGRPLDRS